MLLHGVELVGAAVRVTSRGSQAPFYVSITSSTSPASPSDGNLEDFIRIGRGAVKT